VYLQIFKCVIKYKFGLAHAVVLLSPNGDCFIVPQMHCLRVNGRKVVTSNVTELLSSYQEKIPARNVIYAHAQDFIARDKLLLAILKAFIPQPANEQQTIGFHVFWWIQCRTLTQHPQYTVEVLHYTLLSTARCFQSECSCVTPWCAILFSTNSSPVVHPPVNFPREPAPPRRDILVKCGLYNSLS
jgi:hypothetical protein